MIQYFTADLAEALGIDAGLGAVITQIEPDSAAEAAGLQPGDLIITVDGRSITGSADLRSKIGLMRLGRDINMHILRDGQELTFKATLQEGVRLGQRT